MSLYGEGLRRALLRFGGREPRARPPGAGRLAALPLLLLTPVLLYPLLLAAGRWPTWPTTGGAAATVGRIALGFYSVLAALTVAAGLGLPRGRRRAGAVAGAGRRARLHRRLRVRLPAGLRALPLPALDLGAPFGGLTVVGGVVAVGFWLFLLHLVVLVGLAAHASSAGRRCPGRPVERLRAGRPRCSTTRVLTARVRTT